MPAAPDDPEQRARRGQLQWLSSQPSPQRALGFGNTTQIRRFYELLDLARIRNGSWRHLGACKGTDGWPARGVYFFFDDCEQRSGSGRGPRCVRVGTHAVRTDSKATLWGRLRQHRGSHHGGGNHRCSIFRKLVGHALLARDGLTAETWGVGANTSAELRLREAAVERSVSEYIRALPFTWVAIDDEPSAASMRAYVERNSIALLSAVTQGQAVDPASAKWLGASCPAADITRSGLWNQQHVEGRIDHGFLDVLEEIIGGSAAHPERGGDCDATAGGENSK